LGAVVAAGAGAAGGETAGASELDGIALVARGAEGTVSAWLGFASAVIGLVLAFIAAEDDPCVVAAREVFDDDDDTFPITLEEGAEGGDVVGTCDGGGVCAWDGE
jgi:hypothetical protein